MIGNAATVVQGKIFVQYPLHLVELAVMANAVKSRRGRDAGLFGIEFPNVKIESERVRVAVVPIFHRFSHQRVGQLAKVIAARDRQQPDTEICGRIGKFPDRPVPYLYLMCDPFGPFSFRVWQK